MQEPQAYISDRFVPLSEAAIPVTDMGLALGAAVTEQLRTFAGRLYHLEDHLRRLWHSLEIVGVDPGRSQGDLADVAQRLVATNHALVTPGDDLGLSVFITPGAHPTLNDGVGGDPCVCLHTFRLPFSLWAHKYIEGQALVTAGVQQVPAQCWPAELKCRSRMHYYLADRTAAAMDKGARAILQDAGGHVLEATTANLIVYYKNEGLVAPPHDQVLPGISLSVLWQMAARLGLARHERPLTPDDLARADEILLSSTPFCILPVTRFNQNPVGSGRPGEVFQQILKKWSDEVGFDIAEQARRFAQRRAEN